MKKTILAAVLVLLVSPVLAADAPATLPAIRANDISVPKPLVETFGKIADQLKIEDPKLNAEGLTALREMLRTYKPAAGNVLISLQGVMAWDSRYAKTYIELITPLIEGESSPQIKSRLMLFRAYAMMQAEQKKEGEAEFERAFALNAREVSIVASNEIVRSLMTQKRYDEALALTQRILITLPDTPYVVDRTLRARASIYTAMDKNAEALGELKRYYNCCPLEKTGDVIFLIDRQLAMADLTGKATLELFRKEQLDGAKVPADGQPPLKSTVLAGIKANPDAFEAAVKAHRTDKVGDYVRCACLLLLADKPDEAMRWAKRAYAEAKTQRDIQNASELIGRCMKAQDGTVGRANAWALGPDTGEKKPAAPKGKPE